MQKGTVNICKPEEVRYQCYLNSQEQIYEDELPVGWNKCVDSVTAHMSGLRSVDILGDSAIYHVHL